MQNILITGGSSFLGSKTIDYFKDFSFYGLEHKSKLKKKKNLVTFQSTDFEKIIPKYKIDIIFHFATNSTRNNDSNREDIHRTNVLLGEKLLQACTSSNVELFISSGSYSQEIFDTSPNYYVESKNIFENSLISYSKKNKLRIVNYLLGDVYGKDDFRNDKLINFLLQNEHKKEITFKSNGLGAFAPIHINDILNIMENEISLDNSSRKSYSRKILATDVMTVKEFVKMYKSTRKKSFIEKYVDKINPYSNFKNIDKKDLVFITTPQEGIENL